MNKKVVIREIRKGEQTEVCQLVIECFNEFVAPDYGEEGVDEFLNYVNPELMLEKLQRNDFVLVAMVDDSIIGVIEVRSNNHISLLFVKKEYQARGIARELLEVAIEECRRTDTTVNEFAVNSSPYAVKVYERLGFIRVNDEKLVNGIRFIPMKLKLARSSK